MIDLEKNFENVQLEEDRGFDIRFVTMQHNSPCHWHREMEILYILNDEANIPSTIHQRIFHIHNSIVMFRYRSLQS